MRDSSEFMNLVLLQLLSERPLECREAEREWRLERLVWLCSWRLFLWDERWDEELRCVLSPFLLLGLVRQSLHS